MRNQQRLEIIKEIPEIWQSPLMLLIGRTINFIQCTKDQ
jgi:hypothetical protein